MNGRVQKCSHRVMSHARGQRWEGRVSGAGLELLNPVVDSDRGFVGVINISKINSLFEVIYRYVFVPIGKNVYIR